MLFQKSSHFQGGGVQRGSFCIFKHSLDVSKMVFLAEVEIAVAPVAVSVHVNYLSTF